MLTTASHQSKAIELAIEQLVELAGGAGALATPQGFPHLGLAIVESVFSTRSNREGEVESLLRRYADAVPGFTWSRRYSDDVPWHGASALLRFMNSVSVAERYRLLSSQTIPDTRLRRADVVVRIAELLLSHGIDDVDDLARGIARSEQLEHEVLGLPGVDHTMWRCLLNRSGGDRVKPDCTVVEWVRAMLFDESVSAADSAQLIETAARSLRTRGATYSIRAIDHLIWIDSSGLTGK